MKHALKIALLAAVACGAGASLRPVDAHHAMVMYDRLRTVTLNGTVVELQWTNPHVFLLVMGRINESDEPDVWRLETSAPSNLQRLAGWSATVIKPGDRVSIEINPLREGTQKAARLTKVTLLDTGQVLGTSYLDLDLRSAPIRRGLHMLDGNAGVMAGPPFCAFLQPLFTLR